MPPKKFLLSFLTQLRQPEVTREPVGPAAQGSALTSRRPETTERPRRQARVRRQGARNRSLISMWPLEPQTRTGCLCVYQVPEAVLTAAAVPRSREGQETMQFTRNAKELGWFEKQTLTKPRQ